MEQPLRCHSNPEACLLDVMSRRVLPRKSLKKEIGIAVDGMKEGLPISVEMERWLQPAPY